MRSGQSVDAVCAPVWKALLSVFTLLYSSQRHASHFVMCSMYLVQDIALGGCTSRPRNLPVIGCLLHTLFQHSALNVQGVDNCYGTKSSSPSVSSSARGLDMPKCSSALLHHQLHSRQPLHHQLAQQIPTCSLAHAAHCRQRLLRSS